ncbi:unnamed protein product [marine sediment metagenome]|uniref:Peptidase M15A C-terminal domain-containing protein n=1 Tax=marine sediment metagenome TaxID=412755 RepID=X1EWM3_9ZZZZ
MDIRSKFDVEEMKCKCGCGLIIVSRALLRKLAAARIIFDGPIRITSWCRCEDHNKAEGGSSTSSHLYGEAVDLECNNSYRRFILLNALLKAGFTRIGLNVDYIHVDIDAVRPKNAIWVRG